MKKSYNFQKSPYKICSCGYRFEDKLDLYEKSLPLGMIDPKYTKKNQLELRFCPQCKTSFSIQKNSNSSQN